MEYKSIMKKGRPSKEEFAAMIADKQDNPEIYRDADRREEANQIPLTQAQKDLVRHIESAVEKTQRKKEEEGEEQDNPTLWEIAKKHNVSYADAVPIQEDMRLKRDALKAACTMAEMRKDRTPLANMKKRAEEAEGELSIMKGIETNRVKEAQARSNQLESEVAALKQQLHVDRAELQSHLDRIKRENNDLFNRVADALEVNESHQKLNGKLQVRIAELEDENKKMHDTLEKQLEGARKAGL